MGALQIAIIKRPLKGPHCGDQAGYWQSGGKTILCIIDGLGHGEGAERAAILALDFVGRHHYEPLLEIFACCDKAMRHTRGVLMGIAVVDPPARTLTYAGIGNTRAQIVGREIIRLRSHYGIIGGGYRKLASETAPMMPGDTAILFTDGIEEIIDWSKYANVLKKDAAFVAETILNNWRRATDDAAVIVCKHEMD